MQMRANHSPATRWAAPTCCAARWARKSPRRWRKQRAMFVSGACASQCRPRSKADDIFDLLEKFAGYGFNKSHSAAYALVTYQTAYLKAHYPRQFMAAVLSADMEYTDRW